MIGIVYEIRIGPYKQIGSTHNLEERKYHHLHLLTKNRHYNQFLQRVYNKYGTFEITELCRFLTREEAYKKEQKLLDKYYRQPYYTMEHPMASGGSKPGKEHPNSGKKRPEHSEFLKNNPDKCGLNYKRTLKHIEHLKEITRGKVVCKDLDGNIFKVTKEEYNKREDLVGISNGVVKLNARKPIKCIEDNLIFDSLKEASRYYGISSSNICENLKYGKLIGIKKLGRSISFKFFRKDLENPQ